MDFVEISALDILNQIRRISRHMEVYSRELMKRCGLTVTQLMILRECRDSELVTGGHLAKKLSLSPPTISEVLNRLVNRGLLEREGDVKDRRKIYIKLTDIGRNILSASPPLLQEKFYKGIISLDHEEISGIRDGLLRIADMMGENESALLKEVNDE